jgi:hypothetical protein
MFHKTREKRKRMLTEDKLSTPPKITTQFHSFRNRRIYFNTIIIEKNQRMLMQKISLVRGGNAQNY